MKAGETISHNPQNPVETYKELVKPLVKEFYYAGKIAKLAYKFQRVAYRMGSGVSMEQYSELLKGKITYEELYKIKKDF